MSAGMKGLEAQKFEKMMGELERGKPLTIGVAGTTRGPKVMMGAGDIMMVMSPDGARIIARTFDTPAARLAGLTVAGDLTSAANECEAMTRMMQ